MKQEIFSERARFLIELARRLHQFGTAAPRLEAAIERVSRRLGLRVQPLCTPTSILISIVDGEKPEGSIADHTEVIRMRPGDLDLGRLAQVDLIADDASLGRIDIQEGYKRLREVQAPNTSVRHGLRIICFGVVAASVAILLKASWADVIAAAVLGLLVGSLARLAEYRPRLSKTFEAIAALMATFIAIMISVWITPITVNHVVIASLIVLLPGLMLTTAVTELASEHLVSGMARFAGAMSVLLKLAFGTVAGTQLAKLLQLSANPKLDFIPVPWWTEWFALFAAGLAFTVLFKAARRDILVVLLAAIIGYVTTRYGGIVGGSSEFGVFLGGLVMGALANLYGRIANRPGAIVRVPGIILMVPGSVGFRSLFFVFERDVYLGLDTAFSMVILLACLVVGLLFGNLLVPTRRAL